MPVSHLHLSRWLVVPLSHPPGYNGVHEVQEFKENARTGQGAVDKMMDMYPQYTGIPCSVICIVQAKHGKDH